MCDGILENQRRDVAVVLLQLVRAAKMGQISLSDFQERCPEVPRYCGFLTQIHDALEDAIIHTPGRWFSAGVDWKVWRESHAFRVLCADEKLLEVYSQDPMDEGRFLRGRARILGELDSSTEDISGLVDSALSARSDTSDTS